MLALEGGKPAVSSPLRPYNSIGPEEVAAVVATIKRGPLSGFMGGERHGGLMVQALEQQMCEMFGSKHAVACNSATSGLLTACMAAGIGRNSNVISSPFTMSGTVAPAVLLGADILFADVGAATFNLVTGDSMPGRADALIIPNIFGHPASLWRFRKACDSLNMVMIEDNAQGWFSKENGKYAGTIGHIGVFSFNVHKHLQCGEGGICLTNDPELAYRMSMARNHGELSGGAVGLNLRMTEVEAAIALSQLAKGRALVDSRIELAEAMTHMVVNYPGLVPPLVREGCDHSYYMWALTVEKERDWFVDAMIAEGVPMRKGYVDPLYRLPAFAKYKSHCPTAEWLHDTALATFEICAVNPSAKQLRGMRDAFDKVGGLM